jgi:DNA (cytosine-5)-methyltransferase 1
MMKVLDTFAGAGGFSLGFEQVGCEIIGAIERDAWAAETFSYNHPSATVIKANIEDVLEELLIEKFDNDTVRSLISGRQEELMP